MQMNRPISSSSASDHDNFVNEFNQRLQLDHHDDFLSQQMLRGSEIHADNEDEDEEQFADCEDGENDDDGGNGGDFTFMYVGDKSSPVSAEKVFESGQNGPVFPLFDQNLLSGESYDQIGGDRLPMRPPVDKVFIESRHRAPPSTAAEFEEIEGIAAGPYCTWSKKSATSELNKKSNSTGFSKMWRLRDKVGRSNSDGRDAFVFLNGSDRTTASSKSVAKPAASAASDGGGKGKAVKKGTKVKKTKLSAHEVYLRKREGQTEDERRRSYLPYRPELMGFFTNVNGGLSRNVHPY